MSTIWLDKELEGNLSIEFDVHVISSEGNKNNINCFLLYSHPNGKPLKETRDERKNGLYRSYHKLNGYIITYLANGDEDKAWFRFRYNPGCELLQENFGYNCRMDDSVRDMVSARCASEDCIKGTLFYNEGITVSSFRADNWDA